jgi:hypothetical protein
MEVNISTKITNLIENEEECKKTITYLKPFQENLSLSGFYDIYDENIFEQKKDYIILVKSCFCPFGYNLKISTNYGTIENLSYEKYLINYGDMNLVSNIRIPLPFLTENSNYLLAKFCLKLNKKIILNYLKVKFNVTFAQDYFITQYVDLYIQRFKYCEIDKELKGGLPKKIVISDIVNLKVDDIMEKDEYNVFFNF